MTGVFWISATRKKRKEVNRMMARALACERATPYAVQLRGENAPNNWRRLHGLKPLRRVHE